MRNALPILAAVVWTLSASLAPQVAASQGKAQPTRTTMASQDEQPQYHLGLFNGHDFAHLNSVERRAWERGEWRNSWYRGRYAWWWVVDSKRFFYPAPTYPYPRYVGPEYQYEYYDGNGTPARFYYFCRDSGRYYPSVRHCHDVWKIVPLAP